MKDTAIAILGIVVLVDFAIGVVELIERNISHEALWSLAKFNLLMTIVAVLALLVAKLTGE